MRACPSAPSKQIQRKRQGRIAGWLSALVLQQPGKLLSLRHGRSTGLGNLSLGGVRRHREVQRHAELRQLHGADVGAVRSGFEDKQVLIRWFGILCIRHHYEEPGEAPAHLAQAEYAGTAVGVEGELILSCGKFSVAPVNFVRERE